MKTARFKKVVLYGGGSKWKLGLPSKFGRLVFA